MTDSLPIEKRSSVSLPDYDKPPVVETVVGIQFEKSPAIGNGFLGAYWASLDRAIWPTVSDAPPIVPQFEVFTDEARWRTGMELHIGKDVSSRIQIRNHTKSRMIQAQNDRFHLNWIGNKGDSYPRYSAVRSEFMNLLSGFSEFCKSSEVGELMANQWEVTYVNVIPKDTVWASPSDWSFFKLLGPMPSVDGRLKAETFGGEWHFEIPDSRGRLHIQWSHGKSRSKGVEKAAEFIRLTLTARGKTESGNPLDVGSGLDIGHDVIVRSFRDLMTETANNWWGLRNAND